MKYTSIFMVVLGLAVVAGASPIGVYVDDDFLGSSLDTSVWTNVSGSVQMGKKVSGESIVSATSYVLVDGVQLSGIPTVQPDAGQKVVLTFSGTDVQPWGAYTGFGMVGSVWMAVHAWNWQANHNTNYDIQIGSNKKTLAAGLWPTLASGDWTMEWTQDRIVVSHSLAGVLLDTSVDTPDSGGSWVIPTGAMYVCSYNFDQGAVSYDRIKLEVTEVPEPATMTLITLGSGLALLRRRK